MITVRIGQKIPYIHVHIGFKALKTVMLNVLTRVIHLKMYMIFLRKAVNKSKVAQYCGLTEVLATFNKSHLIFK